MKLIPLSQGFFAKVDDEDYERAIKIPWCVDKRPHTNYASNRPHGRLHQFILNYPKDCDIAHRDGDGLNCQKYNLEQSSRSWNLRQAIKAKGPIPFIGVGRSKNGKPFKARIRLPDGTRPSLGQFNTMEDAARAYDRTARAIYGPEHPINFPEDFK